MSRTKIFLVYNPLAGRNARRPTRVDSLAAAIDGIGEMAVTSSADEVPKIGERIVAAKPEVVAICGGDGTLHHALTAIIRAASGELPMTVLPLAGGTMNTIIRSLGMAATAENALARVAARLLDGGKLAFRNRNIMNVSGRYAFLFGCGIGANMLDHYYRGRYRGGAQAVQTAWHAIATAVTRSSGYDDLFASIHAKVTMDRKTIEKREFTTILIGTVKHVGIGARPLYRAEEREGAFHAIVASFSPLAAAMNAPRTFLSLPMKGDVVDDLARHVRIESETPFRYFLDGEFYAASRLNIDLGPVVRVVGVS
ncbi:hypothetical protein K8I61_19715 [bacterium]|nr:hypothetical protein [bacterium]